MAQIENVSGTAFVVAEFRAEENRERNPLYRDPVVGLFLDEHTRQAADRVAAGCPPVADLVKLRTRYFDDVLEAQLRAGVRQVVILGAGLDTRAVRKPAAGVSYFEIDDESTLTLKECRYEQQGIYANVTFIPGNYVRDGLIEMLGRNGFDFDRPAYFIWEGNTMYLPIESDRFILSELKHYVRRFRVSFDYMAEAVIAKTTGDPEVTRVVENFAQMGAPWVTGIRDVHDFARELGLHVLDNFKTTDLFTVYRPGRPLTTRLFDYYSLCTVGS